MSNINLEKKVIIKSCHDHLGGIFGESILRFFLKEGLIKMKENEYVITKKGWDELEIIGIDVDKLRLIKGRIVNICFESNHGILYEHLGAYLGNLFMERMIELNWIKKRDENFFELTEKGFTGLDSMGIKIKTIVSKQKKFT
jgi:predicted transcriptional regulator